MHLARKRVRNSEMHLVTDSNFIDVQVIQRESELLHAEQPEVEAKLPRLDLRSGFQHSERCKSCPFFSPCSFRLGWKLSSGPVQPGTDQRQPSKRGLPMGTGHGFTLLADTLVPGDFRGGSGSTFPRGLCHEVRSWVSNQRSLLPATLFPAGKGVFPCPGWICAHQPI